MSAQAGQRDPAQGFCLFCPGGVAGNRVAPTEVMVSFIDDHRADYGVEPICAQLQIAPSTFYEHKARQADPERLPVRAKRDAQLSFDIQRVWEEKFQVYGARKIWRQMNREDIEVARCTVEHLIQRQFVAIRPNQLWVADITYVATWSGSAGSTNAGLWSRSATSRRRSWKWRIIAN